MGATWLTGDQPYIVQSPRVNGIVNVANLIDERYGIWKEDVVNHTFLKHEARRILSIPFARNGHVNRLRWCLEKSCEYTVRNGYRLLLKGFPGTASNLYSEIDPKKRQLYRQMWQIKVPEKMKIITWRLIHNYVPTRSNLQHKRLVADAACYWCGLEAETSLHVCPDCPYAALVWEQLGVRWDLSSNGQPFGHWLSRLHLTIDQKQALITITIWALWMSRNKLMHEREIQTVRDLCTSVLGYVKELELLQITYPRVSHEHTTASLGIVIRDADGLIVGAACDWKRNMLSAKAAEALAAVTAI
ncbi:hypothetical protein Gotur_004245 [Gossypium turneri]